MDAATEAHLKDAINRGYMSKDNPGKYLRSGRFFCFQIHLSKHLHDMEKKNAKD